MASGKRILIVDDALELSRMLRAALETLAEGLEIKIYPSAEEALLEITRHSIELLIADIRLPGMSGLDMVRRIRKSGSSIKILLITGLPTKDLGEKALAAGADYFLLKPFLMSEFLTAAAELLGLPPPGVDALKPALPAAQPAAKVDIPGILQRLQLNLGALQVMITDERGRVIENAGEPVPPDFEKQWAPAILTALEAARKAGQLVNGGMTQGALVLRGERQLILAPLQDYALIILLGADSRGLRSALALEEALETQSQLAGVLRPPVDKEPAAVEAEVAAVLPAVPVAKKTAAAHSNTDIAHSRSSSEPVKNSGEARLKPDSVRGGNPPAIPPLESRESPAENVKVSQEEPPPLPVDLPSSETVGPFTDYTEDELENIELLMEEHQPKLDQSETDHFWEKGLDELSSSIDSPEGLSYDEASQLGLTPDSE